METDTPATETIAQTIAPEENLEDKVAKLEAEKAKILEEKENYKKAYLKEAERVATPVQEDDDDRLRRIAREELANSRLVDIAREQDEIIQKALKENKELKLAQLSRTGEPSASIGAHSEGIPVTDTSVTPEQMAFFKSKGWTEQDIERYKTNLRKKA